jgi:DNA (cytosine-5)-methyltransferase 1
METKKLKILNLYACLGGNRYKWGNEHNITAVELDPYLAEMYQKRFPNDTVIVADAHEYLLNHYDEYDFIWSSPPCQTHSKSRYARRFSTEPKYADLTLYEEILFLQSNFKGKWCVENVIPWYETLIPAKKRGRHLYWTNFPLPSELSSRIGIFMEGRNETKNWSNFHKIDLKHYKGNQRKDKIARCLVDYEAGETILNSALGIVVHWDKNQLKMF